MNGRDSWFTRSPTIMSSRNSAHGLQGPRKGSWSWGGTEEGTAGLARIRAAERKLIIVAGQSWTRKWRRRRRWRRSTRTPRDTIIATTRCLVDTSKDRCFSRGTAIFARLCALTDIYTHPRLSKKNDFSVSFCRSSACDSSTPQRHRERNDFSKNLVPHSCRMFGCIGIWFWFKGEEEEWWKRKSRETIINRILIIGKKWFSTREHLRRYTFNHSLVIYVFLFFYIKTLRIKTLCYFSFSLWFPISILIDLLIAHNYDLYELHAYIEESLTCAFRLQITRGFFLRHAFNPQMRSTVRYLYTRHAYACTHEQTMKGSPAEIQCYNSRQVQRWNRERARESSRLTLDLRLAGYRCQTSKEEISLSGPLAEKARGETTVMVSSLSLFLFSFYFSRSPSRIFHFSSSFCRHRHGNAVHIAVSASLAIDWIEKRNVKASTQRRPASLGSLDETPLTEFGTTNRVWCLAMSFSYSLFLLRSKLTNSRRVNST